MKSRKFRDYVPLLILILAQFGTVFSFEPTCGMPFDESPYVKKLNLWVDRDKFNIGVAAVIVCFVAMRFNRRIGKWTTVVTLLAGMLDLIAFTPQIIFGFDLNSLAVEFQAFPFWIMVLFTILNFKSLKRYVKWLLQREAENPE